MIYKHISNEDSNVFEKNITLYASRGFTIIPITYKVVHRTGSGVINYSVIMEKKEMTVGKKE